MADPASEGAARPAVHFRTFGCKANQYDTERMRQELEARGARPEAEGGRADICVVNTCTVTSQADAEARRYVRRLRRENPSARIVVAGCSAALKGAEYRSMEEVGAVVEGHDPLQVAEAAAAADGGGQGPLVQLQVQRPLERMHREPVGGELLQGRSGATRGWLKIQDGCDRKCAFCATRLARGASRSRLPDEVVAEAEAQARRHPELVLTGIHIGHYGRDLEGNETLGTLLERLLDRVPEVRFRLGSVEATEVDEHLLEVMSSAAPRVAPHLHMPLQSGADPVLRRMRRWHTRAMYRDRALEIAERFPAATGGALGLGADIITGFPGETDDDHAATRALVEELPYTYAHVFPFSPREGTRAAELAEEMPVPQRVAGERSRELREIVQAKGEAYRRARAGTRATVVLEGGGEYALTEDYLRVAVQGGGSGDRSSLHPGSLVEKGGGLFVELQG